MRWLVATLFLCLCTYQVAAEECIASVYGTGERIAIRIKNSERCPT